jgi:hypothetical protein
MEIISKVKPLKKEIAGVSHHQKSKEIRKKDHYYYKRTENKKT